MCYKNIIIYSSILLIVACSSSEEPIDEPLIPEAATLVFPEKNTECTTGTVVDNTQSTVIFQWNTSLNTDSYEVVVEELDSEETFTMESNINEVGITINRGAAYEWYVISKSNTSNETSTSETWRFYNAGEGIVSHVPFPADIVEPEIGALLSDTLTANLMWTGSDIDNDILGYEVYFGIDNPPANSLGIFTQTNVEVNVTSGNTYYWFVKTMDEDNNTSVSDVFWFSVN